MCPAIRLAEFCQADQPRGAAESFPGAGFPIPLGAMFTQPDMPDFSSQVIAPAVNLAVQDQTSSQAGTCGQKYDVLRPLPAPK